MMTNVMQGLIGPRTPSTAMIAKGWTISDAYRELDRTIIEAHSFVDENDKVLSRYEDVDRLLPEADILENQGVDVTALARALSIGLSAKAFARAFSFGLDTRLFFLALDRGQLDLHATNHDLVRYGAAGIARINAGLEHLDELYSERARTLVNY
jgi:hypothetical protein